VGAAATVELVVAILLAELVVLAFVVDVGTKVLAALLVVALVVELVVALVVELAGVGVFGAGPCAKAQFEQW